MPQNLKIETLNGSEAKTVIAELSELRISIFRDFPYLYDGNLVYETRYLATYLASPQARVILVRNQKNKIVGASTAIPLSEESREFQEPFVKKGFDPKAIMYFGESLLLPQYRGLGVGKLFFEERIRYAQSSNGIHSAVFCAVVRPTNHPLRPKNYRPLDKLWHSQGFEPVPGLVCTMSWKQIDEKSESPKKLQVWQKKIL